MTYRQWMREKMRKEVSLETVSSRRLKRAVRGTGYPPTLHNKIMLIMGMPNDMRAKRSNWRRGEEL